MASRSLGSLTLDLVAKTGGFERGMDKAARSADKRMKEIERSAKRIGAAIGTALAGAATVVAYNVGQAINRMDELSKAAQRVQMPTEQFSALAYAGSLADVSMGDLQSSLGRLTRSMSDSLKETSRQGAIFKALGIDVRQANGALRDGYSVLLDFADAFEAGRDSPELLAAGIEIFGRSFQNLIPLLKDGRDGIEAAADEAKRLGLILDTEAGQRAEQFNDNLTRLKGAIDGMWRSIAEALLPDLIDLTDEFLRFATEGDTVRRVADDIAESLRSIGNVAGMVMQTVNALGQLRAQLVALEQRSPAVSIARGFRDAWNQLAGRNFDNVTGSASTVAAPFLGVTGKATTVPVARDLDALRDALGGVTDASGKASAARARESDEARKLAEALREMARAEEEAMKASLEAERVRTRAIEDWAQIRAELSGPLAVAELDHIRHLDDIARVGKEAGRSLAEIAEAQGQAKAAHQEATAALKQYQDALENPELVAALDQLRWQFSDLFVDLVDGSGSALDALKRFFDGVAQMITRSIADRWAEALFGKAGTTGSGTAGGGWFANFFSALFGGGKASGGPVSAGRLYEVNEQGTELFSAGGRDYLLAGTDGNITPAGRWGGDGFSQTLNFALAAPTDPRTQQQIADKAMFHGQQATRRNR